MSEIVRFSDVTSMLLALQPDEPVLCVRAEVLRARARSFLEGLPGRVLYAMKCNLEPFVLRVLHEAGIRDFDTASLAEMAWIHDLLPAARCYFHHPVKSRRAIPAAYRDHGVRHFVVDHESELAKLLDCLDARDIAIHVRVKTPATTSARSIWRRSSAPSRRRRSNCCAASPASASAPASPSTSAPNAGRRRPTPTPSRSQAKWRRPRMSALAI